MIRECLFNMLNNLDPIMETKDNWTHLFELQEFLHPGEYQLLRMIMEIALDYHRIVAFNQSVLGQRANVPVDTSGDKSVTLYTEVQSGLYIRAFCSGVQRVLEDYCNTIKHLENMFLGNPQLPLTYVLSSVEKYRQLFEELILIIKVIEKDKVPGCLLIGKLHNYLDYGVDQLSSAAHTIICSLNTVFYRHLCNWIIYGDLLDNYGEFFIVDGKTADEAFLYPEQLNEATESSSNLISFKKSKVRRPPIVRMFYINWDMVPLFMNKDTAESILFMGRIVWIVRNDPKKCSNNYYQINYKRDIWEDKDFEYYNKIQSLKDQIFDNSIFQNTIEECRLKLTKYLWSVMLEEGNLIEHLHLIRDYYALGRGELFQQFITIVEEYLKDSATDSAVQKLNFIFLETARKIYGEYDKTYLKFELTTNTEGSRNNPWSQLQMNFEIKWPLHIVFHPKVMELYNKLFGYLLRLKKTQIDLHKLWVEHMSSKIKIDRRVWTLRQNLMFLVDNLQYYLQVDVIEAQFSLLLKAVENANELEDIIKVHHNFISNLLVKTFVLMPDEDYTYKNKHRLYQLPAVMFDKPSQVYKVIIQLLELCEEFCLVTSNTEAELTDLELDTFRNFQKRSDTIIGSLLLILRKLHEKARDQYLLQLLSHLDFNKYFSKKYQI